LNNIISGASDTPISSPDTYGSTFNSIVWIHTEGVSKKRPPAIRANLVKEGGMNYEIMERLRRVPRRLHFREYVRFTCALLHGKEVL